MADAAPPRSRLRHSLDAVVAAVGGSPRDGQIEVVDRVVSSRAAGTNHVVAEVPTGVGKSLIALAIGIEGAASGHRTVIATHTKALQAQYERDIQRLAESFPNVAFVNLKGRGNYLCLVAAEETRKRLPAAKQSAFDEVVDAVSEHPHADLDSVPTLPERDRWSLVPRDCAGQDCPLYSQCHYERLLAEAAVADVVVTNHAMLATFIDGNSRVVPTRVVVDEAHHLSAAVRSVVAVDIDFQVLEGIETFVRAHLPDAGMDATLTAVRFLWPGQAGYVPADDAAGIHQAVLRFLAATLNAIPPTDTRLNRSSHIRRTRELHAKVMSVLAKLETDTDRVATGQRPQMFSEFTTPRVTTAPVRVSATIANWFNDAIEHGEDHWPRTSVHLSATIASGSTRDPFGPYLRDTGLTNAATIRVASPFPTDAALFYAPIGDTHKVTARMQHGVPTDWMRSALKRTIGLCNITSGRALIVCTSYAMVDYFASELPKHVPWPVLRQTKGSPVTGLIEQFKTDEHSILIGTDTLREGIDVQGPALSLVIYDKLPNMVPSSAYVRAVCGEPDNEFFAERYQRLNMPNARLALVQAVGRLVRSPTDRGIVAVLDHRIWDTRNRALLDSIAYPKVADPAAVRAFWSQTGH